MAQEPWIKRFLPRGLYGRAALILLLPVLSVTLVVTVAFLQRHFDRVTRQMTTSVASELALISARIEAAPDLAAARADAEALAAPLGLTVMLPGVALRGIDRDVFDFSGLAVVSELRRLLPAVTGIDLEPRNSVTLSMPSRFGPLEFVFERNRVSASNPHQLLVLMLATSLLTSGIAFIFLRNQLRPIRRLARAAEGFGRGRNLPFRPAGATEVRAAGMAFLDMRARIERQIEQRTLMLSGVSHDLRTPLTRLRLGLTMLDAHDPPEPAEIEAMIRDVDDMGQLLDSFLIFARDASEAEAARPLAIAPFLRALAEDSQRAGQAVGLGALSEGEGSIPDSAEIPLRETLLRRAVVNLINNAVRYGSRAELGATLGPRSLVIWVEDDGPGIPEDRRAEALRPFTRLDPARNQDRGQGVGLGLSIAADAARAHGGQLRFADAVRLGGLRAEIVLPR